MAQFLPGLPQPGEYHPQAAGYVQRALQFTDPIQGLSGQLREVVDLLSPLSPVQQHFRYAPGKWSIKEMVNHLSDAERVFSYRLMRIARGDTTPLPAFEQDDYVAASDADLCDWGDLLAEFQHIREATILLARQLPEAAWSRQGTASGHPVTARALPYVMIGHVAHHLEVIREKYGLLPPSHAL